MRGVAPLNVGATLWVMIGCTFGTWMYESGKRNLNAGDKVVASSGREFTVVRELGRGGSAVVFEVVDEQTMTSFALKRFPKFFTHGQFLASSASHGKNEILILENLNHENIIQFDSWFEDSSFVYMVIELAVGGDLLKKMHNLEEIPEEETKRYVYQILQGLRYLHANSIVHRDVKLSNVVIDQNNVAKISDFGLSTMVPSEGLLARKCGSNLYKAPEMLTGKGYSYQIDVWALGVTTFGMLFGYVPFESREEIVKGRFVMPADDRASEEAKNFVRAMLVVDPNVRATVNQLLESSWFNSLK